MNPAIVDSLVYISIGIIAAGVIHIIFVRLKQRAAKTETKMDDLIVQSLGTHLVMLAFFIPFFLAVQHVLSLNPEYQWITDFKILTSGYILDGTWVVAAFVDGFLRTYGTALCRKDRN